MSSQERPQTQELLTRGVAEVLVRESLELKLSSGKQLRIKLGIDPTSPHLHIGRAAALLKLRDLEALGHQIVFVVGDFTATIGDTSDKDAERPMLSREEVERNLTTYVRQAGKLIDIGKAEIHYNSEWLNNLSYAEVCEQANAFSVSDFIARDNVARRLRSGSRVSLRELLYPLMQGYDSVALRADVEIGGTDQRFNLLAGRTLQEAYGQAPQDIIMLDLLEGLDGRKMSSSWGNTINIDDEANDMYGKVMSLRDELIVPYFVRATRVPMNEIEDVMSALDRGENPKEAKMRLARAIVALYHGDHDAQDAERVFIETFQKGGVPDDVTEVTVDQGAFLADVVVGAGLAKSKTEWRTLVDGGAVSWMDNAERVGDHHTTVRSGTLKVGKRRFLKIVVR